MCLFVPSLRPLPSNSRDRWLAREDIDRRLSRRRCLIDEFVILRTRPPSQTAPLPSESPSISKFGCARAESIDDYARGRWSSGPTGEAAGKTATPMGPHSPIATTLAASAILRPTLSERVRLMIDTRQFAPATLRNRDFIPGVLRDVLPTKGVILEIASGSGEHVVHFARHFPNLVFQPSDREPDALHSVAAWVKATCVTNVRAPMVLDASQSPWPIASTDGIICINMVHISPWDATLGLIRGAAMRWTPLFGQETGRLREVPPVPKPLPRSGGVIQVQVYALHYIESILSCWRCTCEYVGNAEVERSATGALSTYSQAAASKTARGVR